MCIRDSSSDGSIDVTSVNGNITVHTNDGAVKAAQLAGKIDLATNDGTITVDALKGQIRLHSGDGTISGGSLDGKCEASTKDGQIHLAGRFDALNLRSSDGAVSASAASGSKMSTDWQIQTSDGSVEVALPTDLRANLDASTGDGHISIGLPVTVQGDLSKTHVQGTLNGGGQMCIRDRICICCRSIAAIFCCVAIERTGESSSVDLRVGLRIVIGVDYPPAGSPPRSRAAISKQCRP